MKVNSTAILRHVKVEFIASDEEVAALALQAKAGDMAARQKLLASFVPYMLKLAAARFKSGIHFGELVSVCYCGFDRSIEKYELEKGRYPTFARSYTKSHLDEYIKCLDMPAIMTPSNWVKAKTIQGKVQELQAAGERATDKQIAELMGGATTPSYVHWLRNLYPESVVTFDSPIDDEGVPLHELTPDNGLSPEECAIKTLDNERIIARLHAALYQLKARERMVITYTWGLGGRRIKNQTELGHLLGISQVRVGQILKRAMEKLCVAMK